MKTGFPLIATLAGALLAMPAAAQTAAAPAQTQPGLGAGPESRGKVPPPQWRKSPRQGTLHDLSPEGRKLLAEAMRPLADTEQRTQLKAARDRVNSLLTADRLDAAALGRAMEDERRLVDAQHARRQQALLGALQKMSAEDRKAFAATSQVGRERMNDMVKRYRDGRGPKAERRPGQSPAQAPTTN